MGKGIKMIGIYLIVMISFLFGFNNTLFANNNSNGGFILDGLNFDVNVNVGGGQGGTGVGEVEDWETLGGNKLKQEDDSIDSKNYKKESISDLISRKIESLENAGLKEITLIDLDGNGIYEIIGKKTVKRSNGYSVVDMEDVAVYKFNGVAFVGSTILNNQQMLDFDKGGYEILNFKKGNKNNYQILTVHRKMCRYIRDKKCLDQAEFEKFFDKIIGLKHEHSFSFYMAYIDYFRHWSSRHTPGSGTKNEKAQYIIGSEKTKESRNRDRWKLASKISFSLRNINGKYFGKTEFKNIKEGIMEFKEENGIDENIKTYDKSTESFYFEDGFGYLRNSIGMFEKYKYNGIKEEGFLKIRDFQFIGVESEERTNENKDKYKRIQNDDGKIVGSVNDHLIVTNNSDGTKNYTIVADIGNGEEKILLSEKGVHGAMFNDLDGDGLKEVIIYETFENDKIGRFNKYRVYKYQDGEYIKIINNKNGFSLEMVDLFGGKKKNILIQGIDGKLEIYDHNIKLNKTIKSNETTFADVNFDGKKDIITKQHIKGAKDMGYIQIYLFDEESGEFVKTLSGNGVVGESINVSGFDIDEDGINEIEIHKQNGIKLMKYDQDNNSYSNIGEGMSIKKGTFKEYFFKDDEMFGEGNTGYITQNGQFRVIGKNLEQKLRVATFNSFRDYSSCVNEGCKNRFLGIKDFFATTDDQKITDIKKGIDGLFIFNNTTGTNNLLISGMDDLFSISFKGGMGKIGNISQEKDFTFIDGNGQTIALRDDRMGFGFGKTVNKIKSGRDLFLFDQNGKKTRSKISHSCYGGTFGKDGGIIYGDKIMDETSKTFTKENFERFMSVNGSIKYQAIIEEDGGDSILKLRIGSGKYHELGREKTNDFTRNFVKDNISYSAQRGNRSNREINLDTVLKKLKDNKEKYEKYKKDIQNFNNFYISVRADRCSNIHFGSFRFTSKEGRGSLNRWSRVDRVNEDLNFKSKPRFVIESMDLMKFDDVFFKDTGRRLLKEKTDINKLFKEE